MAPLVPDKLIKFKMLALLYVFVYDRIETLENTFISYALAAF